MALPFDLRRAQKIHPLCGLVKSSDLHPPRHGSERETSMARYAGHFSLSLVDRQAFLGEEFIGPFRPSVSIYRHLFDQDA